MSLSDKEIKGWEGGGLLRKRPFLFEGKDIREAVKELKKQIIKGNYVENSIPKEAIIGWIDKIFGEKLI